MPEEEIGKISRYFKKIGVAGILLTQGNLNVGDTIHIKGHTTDFTQSVESMQIQSQQVEEAGPGDEVGLKVVDRVREKDMVYKVTGEEES